MHRNLIIACAAIAGSLLGPALAGERVAFDRSRLDDPVYVAALYDEIDEAARSECFKALTSSLYYQQQFAECVKETVAAAIAEIGSPALAAHAATE